MYSKSVCWPYHGNDGYKDFVRRSVNGEQIKCVGWRRRDKYVFRDGPVPGTRYFKASIRCCRRLRHRNYKISHGEYLIREIRSEISELGADFTTPSKDIVRRGSRFEIDPWDDYFLPSYKSWKMCLKKCDRQYKKLHKHGPYVDNGIMGSEEA